MADEISSGRAHTGRRRNEAARRDILEAALALAAESAGGPVTVDAIAARSGVGKQTIYRWWPSKSAVLVDAIAQRAAAGVPTPDTGSLAGDLREFLTTTFRGAADAPVTAALRVLAAEAQRDPRAGELLGDYAAGRRAVLRSILDRGAARGELPAGADVDLLVDLAYGLLWYRVLINHGPLDGATAAALTRTLIGGTERGTGGRGNLEW